MAITDEGLGALVSGEFAGERRKEDHQLFQLSMEEGQIKLDTEKYKLQEVKQQNAIQQKVLQQLQDRPDSLGGIGGHGAERSIEFLMNYGDALTRAGAPQAGLEYLKAASTMEKNHSAILKANLDTVTKKDARLAALVDGVTTKAEFNERVRNDLTWNSEEPLDQKAIQSTLNLPDDQFARAMKDIRNRSLTAVQKANLAYKEAQTKGLAFREAEEKAHTELFEVQTELTRARKEHLEKAGGNDVVRAKAADISAITDMALSERPTMDRAKARTKAIPIAEEAYQIAKEQNVPMSAAYKKAYDRHAADFAGVPKAKVRPGRGASNPLPMPKTAADAQDSMIYQTSQGPMYWDGNSKKFMPLASADDEVEDAPNDESDDGEDK